ncbi:MAG: beta-lactamase family protein [Lewinellaceae bacterium]|nr:beta-lactamase family protein [Lewinellaceae bacterium]
MKNTYHLHLLSFRILLGLVVSYWLYSCNPSPANPAPLGAPIASKPVLDSAFLSLADRYYQKVDSAVMNDRIPGLAIALVKEGQLQSVRVWGYSDLNTHRRMDSSAVFRLASVSKGFAPVLTGVLVEKGILHWDDPIIRYLPDFKLKTPEATQGLTIRQVLSHTSGLPRHSFSNLLDQDVPYPEIRAKLASVKITHPPGTYYNYQNVVYSLIADVIEAATGESYADLLQRYIFQPAGMNHSSCGYEHMLKHPHIAYPHNPTGSGYVRTELLPRFYDVPPAAGVNASVADMGRWMLVLMGEHPEIIADSTLQEIFSPQIDVCTCEKNFGAWRAHLAATAYGLGWRIMDYHQDTLAYHGGYVNSYRAEIGMDRRRGIGIVVLENSNSNFIGTSIPLFFDFLAQSTQGPDAESQRQ